MERKFIILIIACITIGSVVGLAGYIVTDDLQQRTNSGLTAYALTSTPCQVKIELISEANWEGNITIGKQSAPASGNAGTYNFIGTIIGVEVAQASFKHTNLISSANITVNIYINGQLMQSDHTTLAETPIGIRQYSPLTILSLLFLSVGHGARYITFTGLE